MLVERSAPRHSSHELWLESGPECLGVTNDVSGKDLVYGLL